MTASEYINRHPRTHLAQRLAGVAPGATIKLGSGLITDNPQSNLQKALIEHNATKYVVGGRAGRHANDGSHFAIILS